MRLVKGLFSETLPVFAREVLKDQPIALLHIDCDLYQSTVDIFNAIGHRLVQGSIVLFDELYNFPKWEEHEVKALHEFLNCSGKKVEYFAYNTCWEQVAVRFI
ncbi:TylF/MycF/NovP-related O-methyltransferase [Endozoicomonas elysicola]|uniref:TylF/MycF/NovP-related O-methyltransferase n=1 Tax=Endozoicomonas elysicola TaxID=305900 RepID=UPI0003A19B54|nr:TylF/MycF/NovP-related O-methyltransferase [Endozoicomonas elysicola]